MEKQLKKATEKGIKIVFIQSIVPGISYEALVGTNAIQCGVNAANVAKALIHNKGEVIISMWKNNKMETIEERAKGFIQELSKEKGIRVIQFPVSGEPTKEEAEQAIQKMLKENPHTNLFFATNVGWGLAYARYLEKYKPDVKVVTVDFTKDVAGYMKKDCIHAAIAQRPFAWGSVTLEILADVFKGKKVNEYTDTGTYEVNLNNIQIFEQRF